MKPYPSPSSTYSNPASYLHATQQAFLEAHEAAFAYFGGVFRLLRYDNLKSAVSKILRGHRREETARFVAFRSHWRFAAEFCTPGEGHEKGGVEGEGGYFRRNHLVPVPDVPDLEAVNALLLAGCRDDEARVLDGRTLSVGSALSTERDHLTPCVAEGFDLADVAFPIVDKQGCVAVRTNHYSVPTRAGTRVEARIYPTHVDLWHGGRRLARHERCYGRRQHVLDLDHYLDVLSHNPSLQPPLRIAAREVPDWLVRAMAVINADARFTELHLGKWRRYAAALGCPLRPLDEAYVIVALSILQGGLARGDGPRGAVQRRAGRNNSAKPIRCRNCSRTRSITRNATAAPSSAGST